MDDSGSWGWIGVRHGRGSRLDKLLNWFPVVIWGGILLVVFII